MTHEELLAKIDAITGLSYNAETNVVTYGNPHGQHRFIVNQALRAVVELHKPGRTAMITGEVVCDGCDAGDNYYSNFYPCPTIQTITEQLK